MKVRPDVCQAILLTSIFWILIDALVLFYFLDPTASDTRLKSPLRSERNVELEERQRGPVNPSVQKELDVLMKGINKFVVFAVWARRNGKWGDSRHNEAKRNERAIQAEPVQHYGFGYDIPQPKLT
ncbi:hypothetical protein L596_019175 [Steinernema carpocapsae]|uniref:Uncharacterized protein n=1 Tax=Steinernema carpocapsae TaxID=34508 RepID=A0A4U5N8E8_STECR|nr:hypothetical protein L596_019175 [Steinernema carpocapsae]